MFILQNSNWITQGENSQIPRFGKICDKLALFRKYLAIYYFFSTRVPQNRVLHSTRASYSRVPCFSFFLFFPTVHAIEFFSISLSHVEALFLLLLFIYLFLSPIGTHSCKSKKLVKSKKMASIYVQGKEA